MDSSSHRSFAQQVKQKVSTVNSESLKYHIGSRADFESASGSRRHAGFVLECGLSGLISHSVANFGVMADEDIS